MRVLFGLFVFFLSHLAYAQSGIEILSSNGVDGAQSYSLKLELLIILSLLSFVPALVLMTSAFTRIIIVLAILRQALGLQQSPPNQVLVGIALALTMLIMKPTWTAVYEHAFVPYDQGAISLVEALEKAERPIKTFMLSQTHAKSMEQMLYIANEPLTTPLEEVSFIVLLPAFILSELSTAFQIGFMLFIPFLIIDLIVASVLMSMCMMMLSPLIISLPFKLILFVLADGWTMTVGSLTASFAGGG